MEIRKLEDFIKNMPENITGIVQIVLYMMKKNIAQTIFKMKME